MVVANVMSCDLIRILVALKRDMPLARFRALAGGGFLSSKLWCSIKIKVL